jgi:large subunit ribosomal protein L21
MYAIIEASGKQYRVSSGETIQIDAQGSESGTSITFDKVLAIVDGAKTTVGAPYVKGARVVAEIVGAVRGKKVLVYKKRARKVYEKLNGHRQPFTAVKIQEVIGG